jgi:hypothetical protein
MDAMQKFLTAVAVLTLAVACGTVRKIPAQIVTAPGGPTAPSMEITPGKLMVIPPCTLTPCTFSTNIAWDSAGTKDTRPSTWGTQASVQSKIPFVNVPAGYRVLITHATGDEIAAYHAASLPPVGSMAYVLVGLTNTTANQSPYVATGLGSQGCFLYFQSAVGTAGTRIPFDLDTAGGLLNSDNILIIKQALFLNDTGQSVHMEATVVVSFTYVKA